ncbi:MAG: replication factor C large subunit [Candidatus Micrarchaeia archaeon]|jgi:replication factor C large subunit
MLLTEKYKPKSITQIIGNQEEIKKVITWALNWQRGTVGKPLLIYGPTGVGKTSVAYAVSNQFDWDLLELNSSDTRDKENTQNTMGLASENSTLFGKNRLILIDDVDKMSSTKDRGGTSVITNLIKTSKHPIILTADDLWDKKISSLRSICTKINLKKINNSTLKKYLKYISNEEGIEVSEEQIEKIISLNSGDVRASLNDLQAKNFTSNRDKQINVFDALRIIFKTNNYQEVKDASFNVDIDHDTFKFWIDENIPKEYEKINEIAKAFDYLSKSDVFDGRIYKRQYWGFLRYSTDLMTAGVSVSKEKKYNKFTAYSFPSFIQKMGASKSKRASNKEIAGKLKKHLHGSNKKIIESIEVVSDILKSNLNKAMEFYNLDAEEAAYILGVSEAQIKKMLKSEEKPKIKKDNEIEIKQKKQSNSLSAFFNG